MMVMTAKVDMKKILLIAAAAVALILSLILLLGESREETATTAVTVSPSANDGRVQFLQTMGWEVTTSPTQSSQVKIPEATSAVFERYNNLQKSQGYDLSSYAGKNVMRYVYQVNKYPGATQPVYATLLVHKDKIIGGDITDTAANGQIRGLKKPAAPAVSVPTNPGTSEPDASAVTQ